MSTCTCIKSWKTHKRGGVFCYWSVFHENCQVLLTKLHSAWGFYILPIHESGVKAMKLNFLALHLRPFISSWLLLSSFSRSTCIKYWWFIIRGGFYLFLRYHSPVFQCFPAVARKVSEQDQWSDPSTMARILQPRTKQGHHKVAGLWRLDSPYGAPGWPSKGHFNFDDDFVLFLHALSRVSGH